MLKLVHNLRAAKRLIKLLLVASISIAFFTVAEQNSYRLDPLIELLENSKSDTQAPVQPQKDDAAPAPENTISKEAPSGAEGHGGVSINAAVQAAKPASSMYQKLMPEKGTAFRNRDKTKEEGWFEDADDAGDISLARIVSFISLLGVIVAGMWVRQVGFDAAIRHLTGVLRKWMRKKNRA